MRLLLSAALALVVPVLFAPLAGAQGIQGTIDIGFTSQNYEVGDAGETVRQTALPIRAGVRHSSGVGGWLRTAYASGGGENLESLSGLADTQVGLSYERLLGTALAEISLRASVPTGQTTLSGEAFETVTALAVDDFAFAVPTLGQGAILSPGVTLAIPAGNGAAVGVGASYSARSAYTPFADDPSEYAPADETILTAGLSVQTGRASTFTLDASYVLYGTDTYRGETFEPGNKLAASMRWAWGGGPVRSALHMRYRRVTDGAIGASGRPVVYLRPDIAAVGLGLSFGSETARVGLSSGVRYYGSFSEVADAVDFETALGGQQVLLDLGVQPSFAFSETGSVQGGVVVTRGIGTAAGAESLSGLRIGGGVSYGF